MSATETVCLWRYQGARARWAARSAAGWPWWAYQTIARLMQTSPNGTRRSTERVVRVRDWPPPDQPPPRRRPPLGPGLPAAGALGDGAARRRPGGGADATGGA